jgi:hypothetical protein
MQYAIVLHQNKRSSRDHHLHVATYNFATQKGTVLVNFGAKIITVDTTTTGSITTTGSRRRRSTTSRQDRSFPPSLQDLHA